MIPDKVIARIAARAAREALTEQTGAAPARLGLALPRSTAAVNEGAARLGLSLDLPYPINIAETSRQVQHYVTERVAQLTGMRVTEVTLTIQHLFPSARWSTKEGNEPVQSMTQKETWHDAGQEPRAQTERPANTDEPATSSAVAMLTKQPLDATQPQHTNTTDDGSRPTRRLWSARRIPAALTALIIAAGAGILLFDISMVRAGHSAAAWRSRLAHELATRPLDDAWMLTGAALTASLGLWLIILALTPGLRHQLPLNNPGGQNLVRAVLDRDAVAFLLRDAAMRVPGVSRARIRVRRTRILAHADIRFRDPADVRVELDAVLHEQRDQLALVHPPRITLRLRQLTHLRPQNPVHSRQEEA
ncbi:MULTISPECIES: DUF6286 domain-containing Asp23/Gls24 family envelope stress response protein [Streptomyces]|uniref:DUF6286 domain-containing Asp23/Gls24 family envelope stress response protein n=1 Tax=Streptomyces TaxID=1883 RepID=UPI0022AE765A|nr:DUF6286 domain-containing Asp23/Gls24 family envelope stress response protein [Streptomyces sp. H39-C1]MCZ4102224.1 DUF6286 domain-containing protein [Streptomyces sp. H39-C1]